MCKVLNARRVGKHSTGSRVYVGRPSKWGNPFIIGRDGTRDDVIAKYQAWIVRQPELIAALHELHGKDLICWCAPEPCHADVLLDLAARDRGG
jgi:predicted amidohydrolase